MMRSMCLSMAGETAGQGGSGPNWNGEEGGLGEADWQAGY